MTTFRPPKPWELKEEGETITTFASWQSNIKYHLSLNNEFAAFIDPAFTWNKSSTPNRGLTADPTEVAVAQRKTAGQKNVNFTKIFLTLSPKVVWQR